MSALGGAWRIQQSGAVHNTYQYKVNSGAGNLVRRATATFSLNPPPTLATNINVPTVACGRDALLFLPDRVLLRSGQRWSDLTYGDLRATATPSRFIESGHVPHDGQHVDTTWQYVNVKGGPDRRFKNNRQLPIMLYGQLRFTSSTGLNWIVDCSRVDASTGDTHPPNASTGREGRNTHHAGTHGTGSGSGTTIASGATAAPRCDAVEPSEADRLRHTGLPRRTVRLRGPSVESTVVAGPRRAIRRDRR